MFNARSNPTFAAWLKGAAEGRSFVTTGPLLLLEVDGERPGGIIRKIGTGPHTIHVRRARQERGRADSDRAADRRRQGRSRAERPRRRRPGDVDRARALALARPLVVDRGAGVRRSPFRRARRRGAHQPGLRRSRRQGPLRPRFARSAGRADRPADGRRTASGASPRRRGCSTTFKSRATSCCESASPAGCPPAGFPTLGSTTSDRGDRPQPADALRQRAAPNSSSRCRRSLPTKP